MKYSNAFLIGLCAVAIVSIAQALVPSAGSPSLASQFTGVRVEYIGRTFQARTTCHLINTSQYSPITIEQVVVLGPGGRTDVIAVSTAHEGLVIEPLAELRIPVSSTSIPGVTIQSSASGSAYGPRNVLIKWSGDTDSLNLTSSIVEYQNGSSGNRKYRVLQGYSVTP